LGAAARKELDHVYREIDELLADVEEESGRGAERETDGGAKEAELAIRAGGENAVVELKLHNLNNVNGAKSGASAGGPCVCAAEGEQKKIPRSVNNGRASSGGEAQARPSSAVQFTPSG